MLQNSLLVQQTRDISWEAEEKTFGIEHPWQK